MGNNYNILLIDDEQHCITVLTHELKQLGFSDSCIFSTSDPLEVAELLPKVKPELLFLDIDMPHLSGFDLLKKCSNEKFNFIVTTAHQRYALNALKASAVDFLLKPVNSEELRLAQ